MSDNPEKQPSDQQTTIEEIKILVDDFVGEREWHQFHSPKNLSMSLAIEVSELMEHFQWITIEESRNVGQSPEVIREVKEELADVFSYALAIANSLDIDIASALFDKMEKNRKKYPADEFKGRYGNVKD